ncbi:MAG TPA: DUF2993 domain-containing protein [Galbitalea sp.]|jgi:hypothetical protein
MSLAEKPRKRRTGLRAFIVILVILVLLVVAFFVGEALARQYATGVIQKQMAKAVGAESPNDVHVSLGSGSFLLQYLGGDIQHVAVNADPVTVEGITGSLKIRASDVPTDLDKPVGTLRVGVVIPVSSLSAKIAAVPQLKSLGVSLKPAGKNLQFSGILAVFGQKIPIGVTATPHVVAGKPGLTLDKILLGKNQIPVTQFEAVVPGLASVLKSGASLCIAPSLPKEFVLTGVAVTGQNVVFALDGDGAKLNDTSLSQKGTC